MIERLIDNPMPIPSVLVSHKEGFKKALRALRVQPDAGIDHTNQNLLRIVPLRFDQQDTHHVMLCEYRRSEKSGEPLLSADRQGIQSSESTPIRLPKDRATFPSSGGSSRHPVCAAQIGDLQLSSRRETGLVDFLKILSSGCIKPNPVENPVD